MVWSQREKVAQRAGGWGLYVLSMPGDTNTIYPQFHDISTKTPYAEHVLLIYSSPIEQSKW